MPFGQNFLDIRITDVDKVKDVLLQVSAICSDEFDTLAAIKEQVRCHQSFLSSDKTVLDDDWILNVGECVLCPIINEKEAWRRGEVREMKAFGNYSVYFVDQGTTELINIKNIRLTDFLDASHIILSTPPLAVTYVVEGISSCGASWTHDDLVVIRSQVVGQNASCVVHQQCGVHKLAAIMKQDSSSTNPGCKESLPQFLTRSGLGKFVTVQYQERILMQGAAAPFAERAALPSHGLPPQVISAVPSPFHTSRRGADAPGGASFNEGAGHAPAWSFGGHGGGGGSARPILGSGWRGQFEGKDFLQCSMDSKSGPSEEHLSQQFNELRFEPNQYMSSTARSCNGAYTEFMREMAVTSGPVAALPPPPFASLSGPPRYYDGPSQTEFPSSLSTSRSETRYFPNNYDRTVDEFIRRTSDRRYGDRERERDLDRYYRDRSHHDYHDRRYHDYHDRRHHDYHDYHDRRHHDYHDRRHHGYHDRRHHDYHDRR